jgi:hypothetical protein
VIEVGSAVSGLAKGSEAGHEGKREKADLHPVGVCDVVDLKFRVCLVVKWHASVDAPEVYKLKASSAGSQGLQPQVCLVRSRL